MVHRGPEIFILIAILLPKDYTSSVRRSGQGHRTCMSPVLVAVSCASSSSLRLLAPRLLLLRRQIISSAIISPFVPSATQRRMSLALGLTSTYRPDDLIDDEHQAEHSMTNLCHAGITLTLRIPECRPFHAIYMTVLIAGHTTYRGLVSTYRRIQTGSVNLVPSFRPTPTLRLDCQGSANHRLELSGILGALRRNAPRQCWESLRA